MNLKDLPYEIAANGGVPWAVGRMRCRNCGHVQLSVYPLTGRYAWQCGQCKKMMAFVIGANDPRTRHARRGPRKRRRK